ncbi:MAG: hypothetical protein SF053_09255 [Bacteroidia bacterium]|nr:hypothetical protein [Bacteroidia bacterium]
MWLGLASLQAQPGTLDPTFNTHDKIGVGGGTDGTVYAQAILSDGKILIVGNFTTCNGVTCNRIARLNSDGSLDTSFGLGTGANGTIYDLALQSDGKIVIGGGFTTYNGTTRNRIARLNADGSLDTGFNPGISTNTSVYTLAIQTDGKILIGGLFTSFGGTSRNRIARLNTNGSLDTGFTPGTGANNTVNTLTLQSDGKILIGGSFSTYNGTARTRIARLNANGSLDTGFTPGLGVNNIIYAFLVQADGKIFIGGEFSTYNNVARSRIARLNTDGSLDTGFNPTGGANDGVRDFAVQSDGKILICGSFTTYAGASRSRIARMNADGSNDTGFTPGTGMNGTAVCMSIQSDDKIVIGGTLTGYNGTSRNSIARANANGTLDTGFCQEVGANGPIYAMALQADGKVLIGGNFTAYAGVLCSNIARLNADGSFDATFNTGSGFNSTVRSIAIQSDGKILVGGGFTSYNGTARNCILRLHTNGSLDTGFNPGAGANNSIYAFAFQPDGKILIGGVFTTYNSSSRNYIARINANGSLDTGFNPGTGASFYVYALSLQADGKILIGGDFTSYNGTTRNRLARINDNGSLDTDFTPGTGANGTVRVLRVQSDGKIVIAGYFSTYGSVARRGIARVNADGSLDTGFTPGTGIAGGSLYVVALEVQTDNTILIGGSFISYNSTPRNYLARLNADGTLYTSFDPGTGASNTVQALVVQPNSQLLIAGDFTSYNGTGRNYIARVNNDGGSFPVSWLYFQAVQHRQAALLKWGTASELQNQGFSVERSADGRLWSEIGFVAGQGNSQTRQTYTFTDVRPLPGANYYRLRQVDFDGRFEYSAIRELYMGAENTAIRVFPNPLREPAFTLQLSAEPGPLASWRLYAPSGQLLRSGDVTSAYMTIETGPLLPGIYLLDVQDGSQRWHERILVK